MLNVDDLICRFDTLGATGSASASRTGRFGYDATEDKGRRKSPTPLLRSEDDELPLYRRQQVITLGRDIRRNFSIAAWAIRKHLDYVARFRFHAATGDAKIDKRLDELMEWRSKPWNFDSARRHSRRKYVRLVEASRTVDGDILLVKQANGRLQAIEADRVRTPQSLGSGGSPLSAGILRKMKFGVVTDDSGASQAYAVNRRGPQYRVGPDLITAPNSFTFERLVPARNCFHVGYFDRFDQTRGISPVCAALNDFRDIYEGIDLAKAQAKVAQLFALALKRNSVKALEAHNESDGPSDYAAQIDFNRGPVLMELDPGDEAAFLHSNNPSANWQAFMQLVIAAALKSLDIPFSFYDESHTNYSGSRGAWLMYDQSADDKRADLREWLDQWATWSFGLLIYQGVLELPSGFGPQRLKWDWIARKVPWIDPLKEIQASRAEVDAGFNSTPGVAESLGLDAYELADQQAAYLKYRESIGLPPPNTLPPVPVQYDPADR
jgi:capsid protein